jgi:uncharacterized protein
MWNIKMSRRAWMRTMVYSSLALAGGIGYYSANKIEVIRQDVPVSGLPARLEGLKIGVMADFHAGTFTTREDIFHAVDLMNREKVDMISLIGDYVDGAKSRSSENVEKGSYIFELLGQLQRPPLGIYAVLGNHDHWSDPALVTKKLSELPIQTLNNRGIMLEDGLGVAGVDDYWDGPSDPDAAVKNLKREAVIIMLSHNPDVNKQIVREDRIRLAISGHTHGGQIRMPFTHWAPWVPCAPKYRGYSGLIKETDKRWTFISKGVGTFFLPIRLSCPPDIAVMRLKKV